MNKKMMDGDRELGQHFEPDRNAEYGGGVSGEPIENLHRCHQLFEQFLLYELLLLSGLARGVVLLINLCPRPGYPTLFWPNLAREIIVPCDHTITLLHTPLLEVLHFLHSYHYSVE